MLRLESGDDSELTDHGVSYIGDAWFRGVFNSLEELTLVTQDTNPGILGLTLAAEWRRLPAEALANLQVRSM